MNNLTSPTVCTQLDESQIKNGFRKQQSFFAPVFDPSSFEIPKDQSCAYILKEYVHLDFTEEEARFHWKGITQSAANLQKKLKRPISPPIAIVDYFTNITHILNAPLIIEIDAFKQTERLAMVDSLTGVFNRRYMDIILKKEINRCARYEKEFSIVLLDIDNFKAVNDTRGHSFGDKVLRKLSTLITESLREEDILCRYGGEEFLIVLPETNSESGFFTANRIRNYLKSNSFFIQYGITFSAGIATYPSTANTLENLLTNADTALYEAKRAGKDQIIAATNISCQKF